MIVGSVNVPPLSYSKTRAANAIRHHTDHVVPVVTTDSAQCVVRRCMLAMGMNAKRSTSSIVLKTPRSGIRICLLLGEDIQPLPVRRKHGKTFGRLRSDRQKDTRYSERMKDRTLIAMARDQASIERTVSKILLPNSSSSSFITSFLSRCNSHLCRCVRA